MTTQHSSDYAGPPEGHCWCWQYGRCLVPDDCVTWDVARPVPFTDTEWKRAYMELRYGRSGAYVSSEEDE